MVIKLFCYCNANTFMHKVPCLLKLIILFAICIITFLDEQTYFLLRILICFLLSVLMFFFAGAKFSYLKELSFVFVLGFFVTVFNSVSFLQEQNTQSANKAIKLLPFLFLDKEGFLFGVYYTVKFFITSFACQSVFKTTSCLQIKNALELIEQKVCIVFPPLKKLHFALILSLAINFIPQVFATWNKVHLASKARKGNNKKNIFSVIYSTYLELQTLFSCLLFQAETKRKAILNRS